jgi:hypothetical protein
MPLPTTDQARTLEWPPPGVASYVRQQREWAAWWSGDVDNLRAESTTRRFWGRQAASDVITGRDSTQTRAIHSALAADIVTTSADLLFGEPIDLVIPVPEATGDTDENVDAGAEGVATGAASLAQETAAVQVTQARLDELRDLLDLDGTLLIAAEVAAGVGGAWLRPAWDVTVADHPLLTVVDPEFAVPEYRMGQLVAVTFWEDVTSGEQSTQVWRHLERHELDVLRDDRGLPVLDAQGKGQTVAVILHGLYLGDRDKLGTEQPLTRHAATARLDARVIIPGATPRLGPTYMPNVLPNRKNRRLPMGRSDFDGVEDGLDALDEVWSSLLRDIRLGVARLMVPEGTLERVGAGPGSGRTFNVDRELMVETDAAPDEQGGKVSMQQGDIRQDDHLATIRALTEGIVSGAGYAPATYGLGVDGAAESGTARAIRERKTFRTLGRKRRYAERAVADVCLSLLAIDAAVFQREGIVPMLPRVGWPDVTADPAGTAARLQLLRAAQAISIRRAVQEAQPDLEPTEVDAEVAAIMAENSVTDPDAILLDQPGNIDPIDEPA